MTLDAGNVLSLRGGGQHILLNPDGIFSSVVIEEGGTPILGTPAVPLAIATVPLNLVLLQRLKSQQPLIELCQKPEGGTPMQCPLSDCSCRKALLGQTA